MNPRIAFLALTLLTPLVGCTKADDYLRQLFTTHSDLVDPGSAMFRNVTYSDKYWETWCGEINAKNRMGGYGGWMLFSVTIYEDGKVLVAILQPEEAPFGASERQRQATADLNKTMADIHDHNCKDTEPAPDWVPFWK